MRNKILTLNIVYGFIFIFVLFTFCCLENPHDNPYDPDYTGSGSSLDNGNGIDNGNGTDTINITGLPSEDTISGELTITADTYNNPNIFSVGFYIYDDEDELISWFTDKSAPYEYHWVTTYFEDGEYYIRIIPFDSAGDPITEYTITIEGKIIDNAIFGTGRFGYAKFKQ